MKGRLYWCTLGLLLCSSIWITNAQAATAPGICVDAENKRFCLVEFASVDRVSRRGGADSISNSQYTQLIIKGVSALNNAPLVLDYGAGYSYQENCAKKAKLVATNNSKYRLVVLFWQNTHNTMELAEYSASNEYTNAAVKLVLLSPTDLAGDATRWAMDGVSADGNLLHVVFNPDEINSSVGLMVNFQCDFVVR